MAIKIDPRPPAFSSGWQELAIIAIVCVTQLLNQAGATQGLALMNSLDSTFPNVTSTDKLWFMAAFPLTAGAFILISGKFGDLYGLKRVMMCGILWSILWCLMSGLSGYTHSVIFFCICRALHGVGVAYVFPTAVGIIGSMYPVGQRKAFVFSLVGAMAPTGGLVGAVFTGLTAEKGHWQWAFYANAIVFAILGVAAWYLLPNVPRHAPPEAKMDWIGSTIGVAALILINVATNQAAEAGWDSPYVLVLFIVGILLFVCFLYIEKRVEWPLIPKEVMNIHIGLILLIVGLGWAAFSVYLYYYWSMSMNLKGWSPALVGATYVTLALSGTAAAFSVGALISRVHPSIMLFIATLAFLAGILMLSQTPLHQTYFCMLLIQQIIIPFGMDITFPAASLVLSDHLPKRHQGMASSLVSTMTNYGLSASLGFAATAEVKVFAHTGDLLKSYHAAMYVGVGIAGLGCVLGVVLILISLFRPPHWDDTESTAEINLQSINIETGLTGKKPPVQDGAEGTSIEPHEQT